VALNESLRSDLGHPSLPDPPKEPPPGAPAPRPTPPPPLPQVAAISAIAEPHGPKLSPRSPTQMRNVQNLIRKLIMKPLETAKLRLRRASKNVRLHSPWRPVTLAGARAYRYLA